MSSNTPTAIKGEKLFKWKNIVSPGTKVYPNIKSNGNWCFPPVKVLAICVSK